MKYLNLGCGSNFSISNEWTNIDFIEKKPHVIGHNLLNGIPFADETFHLVYHSHVLEHFSKKDGEIFLKECFRVLKPNGILRIAIPDLEQIVRQYLNFLELGLKDPKNEYLRSNYEWMMLEMYDQTVRNYGGGEMLSYLSKKNIPNEDFVYQRIGEEGKKIREILKSLNSDIDNAIAVERKIRFKQRFKSRIKRVLLKKMNFNEDIYKIGLFRVGGEIHQWMYDRYSLSYLLENIGGVDIEIKSAFESKLHNWTSFQLDGKENIINKPDSIFIECMKI